MKPKISVLMASYNEGKYLKEAIDSILNQTFKDFELIIINDGSSDNTSEILSIYADERIKIISNEVNIGLIGSLNKGLKECRGEFIARFDADDISEPTRLEEQLMFLEDNQNYCLVGSGVRLINSQGDLLAIRIESNNYYVLQWKMLINNPFIHPTWFFRRKLLKEMTGYLSEPENEYVEDYDFLVRLSKICKATNIKKPLLRYRIHGEQVSQTKREEQRGNYLRISLSNIKDYVNIGIKELINLDKAIYGKITRREDLRLALRTYKIILNGFLNQTKMKVVDRVKILIEYYRLKMIIIKSNNISGIYLPKLMFIFFSAILKLIRNAVYKIKFEKNGG